MGMTNQSAIRLLRCRRDKWIIAPPSNIDPLCFVAVKLINVSGIPSSFLLRVIMLVDNGVDVSLCKRAAAIYSVIY